MKLAKKPSGTSKQSTGKNKARKKSKAPEKGAGDESVLRLGSAKEDRLEEEEVREGGLSMLLLSNVPVSLCYRQMMFFCRR